MIPRSHGSMFLAQAQSSSSDALCAASAASALPPPSPLSDYGPSTLPDPSVLAKRRSTGASEALQYYWSSNAGGRSESISSSLGCLTSPLENSASHPVLSSPYSISPNPFFTDSRSQASFQEVIIGGDESPSPRGTRGLQLVAEPDTTIADMTTTTPPAAAAGPGASPTLTSTTSRRTLPMIPDAGMTPHGAQNTSHSMHHHQQQPHNHSPSPSPSSNMTVDADTIRSSSTRRKRPPLPPIPTSTPQTSSPASTYSSHSPPAPPRRLPSRPPSRPSSESGESQYSADDNNATTTAPIPPSLIRRDTAIRDELLKFNSHRKGMVDMHGDIDVLVDPSYEDYGYQAGGNWNSQQPDSAASTIAEKLVTPTQEIGDERVERPRVAVNTDLTEWGKTPSPPSAESGEKTPQSNADLLAKPSPVSSSNSSAKGRLSVRGSDGAVTPNRSSSGQQQQDNAEQQQQQQPRRLSATAPDNGNENEQPRSAPAHKTSFGDDLRLPGRPASLLPAAKMEPPKRSRSLDQAEQTASVVRQQPSPSSQQQQQQPQLPPRRSPDPPPRSELRQPNLQAVQESSSVFTTSPTSTTPPEQPPVTHSYNTTSPYRTTTLPTIINTPHTPVTSPRSSQHLRSNTDPTSRAADARSSVSTQMSTQSGTIQDITHVLDNAVDEIGLINSQDTPPPMLGEPEKSVHTTPSSRPRSDLATSSLPPRTSSSISSGDAGSLSPTSAHFQRPPMHAHSSSSSNSASGLGLMGSIGVSSALAGTQRSAINVGQSAISVGQNVGRHVRKASSILSLRSSSYTLSPTNASFQQQQQHQQQQQQQQQPTKSLPLAIMFGNIKALKTSGDRARAYQKGIEGLGRADSGLREWCANTRNAPRQHMSKSQLGLGIRHPSGAPRSLADSAPRNVSGASEFPTRQDSTAACEISVRNMESTDVTKPLLATNLPFPQLTTVKGSGSMQSLASIPQAPTPAKSRTGGGLFSALRLKKEEKNTSLGPPTNLLAGNGVNGKVRSYTQSSTSLSRASIDSPDGPRPPSHHVPSPHGPRPGPTSRQSYDSSRSSLDSAGILGGGGSHHHRSSNNSRGGSFGSASQAQAAASQPPHGFSPLSRDDGVSEEDVRYMLDMLPHAERSTIRSYLERYKDTSYAMTAYLEDEKRGELLKA